MTFVHLKLKLFFFLVLRNVHQERESDRLGQFYNQGASSLNGFFGL